MSRLQSLSKNLPALVLSPARQNSPAIENSGFYLSDGLWHLSLGIQPVSRHAALVQQRLMKLNLGTFSKLALPFKPDSVILGILQYQKPRMLHGMSSVFKVLPEFQSKPK